MTLAGWDAGPFLRMSSETSSFTNPPLEASRYSAAKCACIREHSEAGYSWTNNWATIFPRSPWQVFASSRADADVHSWQLRPSSLQVDCDLISYSDIRMPSIRHNDFVSKYFGVGYATPFCGYSTTPLKARWQRMCSG